ncbi:type II secretion system GspH family protein [Clostridium sp. LY3-2]|uniref:type II secretion system protein n=1 Tax=Clostridium sp. LY3-2 TaxID=2942482 RepID=UPI0021534293|nr:type II secretion system protein [Clostridium sp. LY3-2]MCR6514825.1 type II secretion system GspH family protein [Clostridium sp. LY3-2]
MVKLIRKGKKKKGFTLIELVAVVAIIGILAAILVPKIAGYMKEAKKTAVIDQSRKVTMAVDAYKMKGGKDITDSTSVYVALAKESVASLASGKEAQADAVKELNKLKIGAGAAGDMTIKDCYDIVNQKADCSVDDNGVWKSNTPIATS